MQQLSRRERLRMSVELPRMSIVMDKETAPQNVPNTWNEPSPRPETLTQVERMAAEIRAWDDTFHAWTRDCCVFRDGSWGKVSKLYASQTEWAHETRNPFLCERETFIAILQSLGFSISAEGSQVYGLLLKKDVETAEAAPARQHTAVEKWLRSTLEDGPKAIKDVDRAGRALGHTRAQIFDAAETLQLTKARIHDRTHWCSDMLDSNK